MKKGLQSSALVLVSICITVQWAGAQTQSSWDAVKAELRAQTVDNYNCAQQRAFHPDAFWQFIYPVFGKVALDNKDYISNAQAVNFSFDNDKAVISGNYSNNKSQKLVWNIGAKLEATDGMYEFLKEGKPNYGGGLSGGFSRILGSGVYYKNPKTCDDLYSKRLYFESGLLVQYYDLLRTDTAAINAELNDLVRYNSPENISYDSIQNNRPSIQDADLAGRKEALEKRRADYLEVMKCCANPDSINRLRKRVKSELVGFDSVQITKLNTGYKIHWIDFTASVESESKKFLDTSALVENFAKQRVFWRGGATLSYNFAHYGPRTQFFLKAGLFEGYTVGYDRVDPYNIQYDSIRFIKNRNVFKTVRETSAVYDTSSDKTLDKYYFQIKANLFGNIFFGAKKRFGLEGSVDVAVNSRRDDTYTLLNAHAGLLFSPFDGDEKTNSGTIGLIVGIKKVDLDGAAPTIKNLTVGIRVGIPLSKLASQKSQ